VVYVFGRDVILTYTIAVDCGQRQRYTAHI